MAAVAPSVFTNPYTRRKFAIWQGPIAAERLIECFPNSLVYKLKTPWRDGTREVFKIDVTVCPKCQGRLEQIAVIKDKVVIRAILKSLNEVSVFLPMETIDWRGPPTIDECSQDLLRDDFW